jgi:hypothetical protein
VDIFERHNVTFVSVTQQFNTTTSMGRLTLNTVSEIGDAEKISKSYVSRILRLALLAPDIVEAILAGSMDQGVMLEQLEGPLPSTWAEQREHLC